MANPADPASLSDEELDKLIKGEELEEETPEEEPKETPPEASEEPEPKEEEKPEEPAADPPTEGEEEEKPPSRREQLRIQQLLEKYKDSPKKTEAPSTPDPEALDYENELEASPEIIEKLKADRTRATESAYDRAIQTQASSEWRTLLQVDAPQVESKYAILNPKDTENFHPALATALSEQYLNLVGYDPETRMVKKPGIRWTDYVESQMELAEEIASSKIADARANVTKQAAQTGLRPDGSTTTKLNLNQAPESMTDEELDAIIATAVPSR